MTCICPPSFVADAPVLRHRDCEDHGEGSDWYNSPEQVEVRRLQDERWEREARIRRQNR